MKLISCIIRPYKIDEVREALIAAGVSGNTASEVRGFGRQKGHTELYRGAEYVVDFLPKLKLEVVAEERLPDVTLEAVQQAAKTSAVGDGKIFVSTMDAVIPFVPANSTPTPCESDTRGFHEGFFAVPPPASPAFMATRADDVRPVAAGAERACLGGGPGAGG